MLSSRQASAEPNASFNPADPAPSETVESSLLAIRGVGVVDPTGITVEELASSQIGKVLKQYSLHYPSPSIKEAASHAITLAERLPQIIEATDKVMGSMTEGGVKLHPETVARFAEESAKRRRSFWPVWLALFIAALALLID